MPREKEAYRDNFEDLLNFFDGKRVLTITDVCNYTRHSYRWVKKRYPFTKQGDISVATLARALS